MGDLHEVSFTVTTAIMQYIRDDVQWIMLPDMLCNRIKGFARLIYSETSEAFGDTDIDRNATPRDLAAGAHISLAMSVFIKKKERKSTINSRYLRSDK